MFLSAQCFKHIDYFLIHSLSLILVLAYIIDFFLSIEVLARQKWQNIALLPCNYQYTHHFRTFPKRINMFLSVCIYLLDMPSSQFHIFFCPSSKGRKHILLLSERFVIFVVFTFVPQQLFPTASTTINNCKLKVLSTELCIIIIINEKAKL